MCSAVEWGKKIVSAGLVATCVQIVRANSSVRYASQPIIILIALSF